MRNIPYICNTCLRSSRPAKRTVHSTAHNPKTPLRDLPPSDLHYYWDTKVPTPSQLAHADAFFQPNPNSPSKLWTASKFRTTPLNSQQPEVVFLGRSNVGKSSLLNAVMGREICFTSSKPGRTRVMNAFGIGAAKAHAQPKIVLLDMPGYGKASRAEWGVEIMKYLQGRKQLRRAFLLVDALHGLKGTDLDLLALFRQYAIPHQVVLAKVDRVLGKSTKQVRSGVTPANVAALRKVLDGLRPLVQPDARVEGPGALGEIVTCSAETGIGGKQALGVNALRWSILAATGFGGSVEVKSDPLPSSRASSNSTVSAAG